MLGVKYRAGTRAASEVGIASALGSQSYKMTNSGKGGFSLTDDPEIAAQAAVNRVAYEAIAPASPT